MSPGYASVALVEEVRAAEERLGSGRFSGPLRVVRDEPRDALTASERRFVAERDGFYLAGVSSAGWPFMQFCGGPPGFVRSPDEHTLTWADVRTDRPTVAGDDPVALFFMDYAERLRLKVFGRAAVVERIFTVTVVAYDWDCQQYITPRYSVAELRELISGGRT